MLIHPTVEQLLSRISEGVSLTAADAPEMDAKTVL
jgi:hypothetical protein